MIDVTKEMLVRIMPECSHVVDPFVEPLNEVFRTFEINTIARQAAFLAQIGHESVRFTVLAENLNYSVKGLIRVYPQFFTPDQATEYAHKPLRIASRIYAGRFGNRDEQSCDGWVYRGRGLLKCKLIGASNYRKCGAELCDNSAFFIGNPDLIANPDWATRSAAWAWEGIGGNELADEGTEPAFRRMTRRLNGGLHGIQDRLYLWQLARWVLEGR